ncbi:MAG: hypothetical protein FWG99_08810 [Treponema sp.]|nr:hypothetical protein [Treponema sp.]
MKKLVAISILLALITTAAFAQLSIGFHAEAAVDLFSVENGTGKAADNSEPGDVNFLSIPHARFGNGLGLSFTYTGENYEAFLDWDLGALADWEHGPSFYNDNGATFLDVLGQGFGDWYFKGDIGIFSGYVGNEGDGSKISFFADAFNGDFFYYDDFEDGFYCKGLKLGDTLYYITAGFEPVYVTIGTSVLNIDPRDHWNSDAINMGLRVELDKLADVISLGFVYRIQGGNETSKHSNDLTGSSDPDGNGAWQNSIGVYANLFVVDGLDIAFGVATPFTVYEDDMVAGDQVSFVSPFLLGIDLAVQFTGVENLTVGLITHMVFGGITGSDNPIGVYEGQTFGKDEKASLFGLYMALGGKYGITENLTVGAQLAFAVASSTAELDVGGSTEEYINNDTTFSLGVYATYEIGGVTLQTGLSMATESSSGKQAGSNVDAAGEIYFGIPVHFKVSW